MLRDKFNKILANLCAEIVTLPEINEDLKNKDIYYAYEKKNEPWLVWLSALSTGF